LFWPLFDGGHHGASILLQCRMNPFMKSRIRVVEIARVGSSYLL